MEHKICRENLSAYLDGELLPGEKAQVAAHLAGCPDCRARLDQLGAVSALVKKHALEPVPLGLKKAALAPAPGRPWLKPALAFSAAAAGLLVVFNLSRTPEEARAPLEFGSRMSDNSFGTVATEPAAETAAPQEAPAAPASSLYPEADKKYEAAPAVAAARGSYAQAKFAAPRAAGSIGAADAREFRGRVAVQVSLPGQTSAAMRAALAFLREAGTPAAAAAPGRLVFIKNDGSRVALTEADCAYGFILFDGRQDPLPVADPAALAASHAKYFGAAPGR